MLTASINVFIVWRNTSCSLVMQQTQMATFCMLASGHGNFGLYIPFSLNSSWFRGIPDISVIRRVVLYRELRASEA